jgi:hypothetical protein
MTVTTTSQRDASWITRSSWRDDFDRETRRRNSSLGRPGDFHAGVREYIVRWTGAGLRARPVFAYSWHVVRQRTMREGKDGRGLWWTGDLAAGEQDSMPKAKTAAMRAMRQLRARHLAAGGDVGYP